MKNLLLILPLFLFACSTDSDTEPEFDPFMIGTFEITSETTADWVGSAGKAKFAEGDTVQVSDTTDHNMSIYREESFEDDRFNIQFEINELEIEEFETGQAVKGMMLRHYPALNNNGGQASENVFTLRMEYDCQYSPEPHHDVMFTFTDPDDGSLIKAYQFQSEGFEETIRHIMDC